METLPLKELKKKKMLLFSQGNSYSYKNWYP